MAELKKPTKVKHYQEASEEDINNAAIQDIEDDYLSQEELNYYLS